MSRSFESHHPSARVVEAEAVATPGTSARRNGGGAGGAGGGLQLHGYSDKEWHDLPAD
jgi:hypothetical protein